ncbi:SAM-dependent methyltransferase [Nonomuraea sp. NPDC049400]|uniref:SAM-dependent methyltransferase n=1 Tax=Nonomuraea sp. NPDC049400 TaxID=3364352 RepID=UPI0037A0BFCC
MERESPAFDPHTPNVARLYDYFLGGKDHFPADRAVAAKILEVAPELRAAVRANRAFVRRAVRFLAESGITQFLDIGTGLPTLDNVHAVARKTAPEARVVYVDRDPVVLVHARALLAGRTGTTAVDGDLREPDRILKNHDVTEVIDFDRPVGVLLTAVMHYLSDSDRPHEIVASLRDALAPGSHLIMSHATSDARAQAMDTIAEVYESTNIPLTFRSRERIAGLLEGFELVDPGLVWLPEWRPDQADTIDFVDGPESSLIFCGVGRKG